MANERKDGYYWVRQADRYAAWEIALFERDKWYLGSSDDSVRPDCLADISETRLKAPDEV